MVKTKRGEFVRLIIWATINLMALSDLSHYILDPSIQRIECYIIVIIISLVCIEQKPNRINPHPYHNHPAFIFQRDCFVLGRCLILSKRSVSNNKVDQCLCFASVG